MAVFLDLENIALGAHDADFPAFDIRKVLERLLLKGQIVVKKAYCDFERYKTFKRGLHEAAFELIEIPHVRQSGKNSADIRMVVDALDLCYTKSHVDTFVIISGDSDFSPLVSKLRENDKTVIGVPIQRFNIREAMTRPHFPPVFLAIRSMSAIGIKCHWSLVPPAATRFPSSIIIAVIVRPHREQFRRGSLTRNTCSK